MCSSPVTALYLESLCFDAIAGQASGLAVLDSPVVALFELTNVFEGGQSPPGDVQLFTGGPSPATPKTPPPAGTSPTYKKPLRESG
jgi:hypothetical protein